MIVIQNAMPGACEYPEDVSPLKMPGDRRYCRHTKDKLKDAVTEAKLRMGMDVNAGRPR